MKDVWSLSYAERCLQSIQDTESDISKPHCSMPQLLKQFFLLHGLGPQARRSLVQKQIYC